MNKLVIDIGNTRIKGGIFHGGNLLVSFDEAHAEGNATVLKQLIFTYEPQFCLVSNVHGHLFSWLDAVLSSVQTYYLDQHLPLPFVNHYHTKETLGADRKALVAAAMKELPAKDALVIDAGTCITYDLLLGGHTYVGGNISPGLQMRLRAMHEFTGALPLLEPDPNVALVGKSTTTCMQSGAMYGMAGEIDAFIQAYEQLHPGLTTLFTGGDAEQLAKHLKSSFFVRPHLLLDGLNHILEFNVA